MRMRFVSIYTVSGGLWFAASPLDAQQPMKIFVVNSAADTDDFNPNSGVMTLRKALRMADETPELDEIDFNIAGPSTIHVNGAPDWTVLDDHHVLLHAERAAKGHGRVYTIQIMCVDSAGRSAMAQVIVTVPQSQGGK